MQHVEIGATTALPVAGVALARASEGAATAACRHWGNTYTTCSSLACSSLYCHRRSCRQAETAQVRALCRQLGVDHLSAVSQDGHNILHLGIEQIRLGEVQLLPRLLLAIERVPLWLLDRSHLNITQALLCSVVCFVVFKAGCDLDVI